MNRIRTVGASIVLAALAVGCGGPKSEEAASTSPTIAPTQTASTTPSSPASGQCFDRGEIVQLVTRWRKTASDLSHLRANEDIALRLAVATAGDPVVAGHFKDAADTYAKAPAGGDGGIGSVSSVELSKAFKAMADGSEAMAAGVDSLTHSSVPFC
jgi:hypothetical protein